MKYSVDLVVTFILAMLHSRQVDASTTYMCAQVGGERGLLLHDHDWESITNFYTIGAKNFKMKYAGAFDTVTTNYHLQYNPRDSPPFNNFDDDTYKRNECPYNFNTLYYPPVVSGIEYCPKNVAMRVYTVQQGGRTLQGWLHVEIELLDKSDRIAAIYVQMRDEHANAVGEFVTGDGETCTSSKPELASPTQYQVLPCSAIGLREPKPCSALYMVRKDRLDRYAKAFTDPKYLGNPPTDPSRGISFTWRFSEYWCSRHSRIRPDAMIVTEKNIQAFQDRLRKKWNEGCENGYRTNKYNCYYGDQRILRKGGDYWMRTEWFGGYDIVQDLDEPLKCNEEVMEVGRLTKDIMEPSSPAAKTWLKQIIKSKFEYEYVHPKNMYKIKDGGFNMKSCQVLPLPSSPSFAGRCAHLYESHGDKIPKGSNIHGCNKNASSEEFQGLKATFQSFKSYKKYIQTMYGNRTAMCQHRKCEMPKPHEKHILLGYPRGEHLQNQEFQKDFLVNATRTPTNIARFRFGRKYHGMMCILSAMYLGSISIFSARYLKETYMWCICMGLNFWFYVHVGCSIGSIGFYFTSVTALMANVESWGRSQNGFAFLHNYLGWFSLSLFGILFISGLFRCGREKGRKFTRVFCLSFHSVLGFVHYITNMAVIGFSTRIPGSPSVDKCDRKGRPEKKGFAFIAKLVMAWLIVDMSFHIFLTIIQVIGDRKRRLRRGWYCPILPIMPSDAERDMRGSGLRKLLFIFYCILCTGFSFGAIGYLGFNGWPKYCEFGEMSCNTKKYPFGCTEIAKAYTDALKQASGYRKT